MARHCDEQPGDRESIEKFEHTLSILTGMVEEAIVINPVYLLSPVLRECLRDKAREVKKMHDKIKGRIVVDNLGEPLNF